MVDNTAIEVGPSRFTRAVGVLIAGALAITPAAEPAHERARVTLGGQAACAASIETVRPRASIRRRAEGVNARYLPREFSHAAAPAR